ncbi:uncharacterized protein TNCV_2692371 [Trichonephila clavipes]|uniref:Uncharacterized protein n=1 Tax=Trichonephila clavipes TaxID=2585209 RepID=A0A8X6VZA9_TRICX|nr:uncharacterized protein TNCV_2692371 [Trichonephila clavipes]
MGIRALALNSREQLIQEQRENPELGHIYRYFENPEDGSVNANVCEEENHDNWDRFLHEFSFALRTAVNETTGKTPAELFLGQKIIMSFRKLVRATDGAEYVGGNIENLFDDTRQNIRREHKMWGKYYNRKRREVNMKINDLVLEPKDSGSSNQGQTRRSNPPHQQSSRKRRMEAARFGGTRRREKRTRRTTGGAEEYEDRQPTTEQPQKKEPQCGSIGRRFDK